MTEWHKYPEEKPTESKEYWVTVDDGDGKRRLVHEYWYGAGHVPEWSGFHERLLAWMDIDEPQIYEGD